MEVPVVVREKALAVGAEAWLETLPELVRELEAEWEIAVGKAFPDSTEAFVSEATCADGTRAVLKLIVPRDGEAAAHEATVLRLAAGEGCPRLLREDVARGALLLERLGRSLYQLQLPVQERHEILVSAAERIWRPAPASGLPSGAAKARWLAEFIGSMWEELDRPCSERAIEHALACAERRGAAHRDETAVLVHGDVHQWNALEGGESLASSSSTQTACWPSPSTTSASSCARTRSTAICGNAPAARGPNSPRCQRHLGVGVVERVSTGSSAPGSASSRSQARC
jgi:streptomycin 6-kinase